MKNKNCPNCGAVIEMGKIKCEYCGTSYFDISCIPLNEPFYLTINVGTREKPQLYTTKVYTSGAKVTQHALLDCNFFDVNGIYHNAVQHTPEIDLHFIGCGGSG